MLARIAEARFPPASVTNSPVTRSVATATNGTVRSLKSSTCATENVAVRNVLSTFCPVTMAVGRRKAPPLKPISRREGTFPFKFLRRTGLYLSGIRSESSSCQSRDSISAFSSGTLIPEA